MDLLAPIVLVLVIVLVVGLWDDWTIADGAWSFCRRGRRFLRRRQTQDDEEDEDEDEDDHEDDWSGSGTGACGPTSVNSKQNVQP